MRVRPTARLLVIDQHQRILLFKLEDAIPVDPAQPDLTMYWVTPGGGVEAGESFEAAGRRELWEETGIEVAAVGPWVWQRARILHFPDGALHVEERYFLVPMIASDVSLAGLHDDEKQVYRDHRWWSLPEIEQSSDVFLPPGLPQLLHPLLAGQLPSAPLTLPS